MVAKSFPRKKVPTKNFHQNFFRLKFVIIAKSFPRKQVPSKIFIKLFLFEHFLWLQNHFLQNRFVPKIFIHIFWSKIFYGCKIISSKTGSYQKFSSNLFLVQNFLSLQSQFLEYISIHNIFINIFFVEIFAVAKSFPQKQVPTNNFHGYFLGRYLFYCSIINSSKTVFNKKFSSNIFWSKIFYHSKIISSGIVIP